MSKKYDIYYSFADTLYESDKQIASDLLALAENLAKALKRLLARDVNICVKQKDFSGTEYNKYQQNSSVAVLVMHPKYVNDEQFNQECEAACTNFKLNEEAGNSSPKQVFKVILEPFKEPYQLACIEELLNYNFFEKNPYNRRTTSMSFDSADLASLVYHKLLDLAYDISITLDASRENFIDSAEKKYVYLGLTTFDQQKARDEIKRELLHYGYTILPNKNMPLTKDEFELDVNTYLSKSSLVVQLMGTQYGEILKGTKYSMNDYQNNLIREYQKQNNSFKRYIWIPQNTKISDQRQVLYLKRLRRDDASANAEIIESALEAFKTFLTSRLDYREAKEQADYENISKVYLLTEEDTANDLEELYSSLSLSGLKVKMLDYNEQTGIYARHLQMLKDSDAVIIYQKSENSFWLSSKLRDLVKAPGLGRKKPFKKVLINTPLLPDAQLIRMIKSKVEVIDNQNPEPDTVLQKLITE